MVPAVRVRYQLKGIFWLALKLSFPTKSIFQESGATLAIHFFKKVLGPSQRGLVVEC